MDDYAFVVSLPAHRDGPAVCARPHEAKLPAKQVFADAVGGKVGPGGMSRNAYLLQYVRKDAVPALLHAGNAGLPLDPSQMCEEGGR